MVTTRMITTNNLQDNSSSFLIIFDEPMLPNYSISNKTKTPICFCKVDLTKKQNQ